MSPGERHAYLRRLCAQVLAAVYADTGKSVSPEFLTSFQKHAAERMSQAASVWNLEIRESWKKGHRAGASDYLGALRAAAKYLEETAPKDWDPDMIDRIADGIRKLE